jgi:site-specific DNA-methyltransferase (adenine-specific)
MSIEKYLNKIHLMDCMDLMAQLDDKSIDLAIVDPPYGIERFKKGSLPFDKTNQYSDGIKWDVKPEEKYFDELFRVSKHQIIWGANNFTLPESEYFIIWDKMQTVDNFASAEYAYTDIKKPAQVFRYSIHKEMHNRKKEGKIHPTQKPVALYKWILINYAKPGNIILDTHSGSGSCAIACIEEKFDFIACELDPDYYKASLERLQLYLDQGKLF